MDLGSGWVRVTSAETGEVLYLNTWHMVEMGPGEGGVTVMRWYEGSVVKVVEDVVTIMGQIRSGQG